MRIVQLLERLGRRFRVTPMTAIAIAVALLATSLALAVHNEKLARDMKLRQAVVQADILGRSLAAPLAFDDRAAARDYINAVRANPDVLAAGAYDTRGRLAAGFTRSGPLPSINRIAPPNASDTTITVSEQVVERGSVLGSVYLRLLVEPLSRRAMRYLGIGVVLVMASLLVAVLGTSYATTIDVNRRLQREIDNRRKAEDALLHAQKMEAMGQLTGGVAHDFNNLLTPIIGSLDMLARRSFGSERERRLIDGALQSAERAKTLVQRLLAFARRQPLQARPVDLARLVAGMESLLTSTSGPQVAIQLDLPPDLPPANADPNQLEMAILNLGVNARDAMPGGGTLTIAARRAAAPDGLPPGDYLHVSIADTGAGMDAATLARAVEPFFSTKGVGKGTGLGLSMVHGLMSQLGGTMTLSSAPGHGTIVGLYLPVSSEPLPAAIAVSTTPATHRPLGRVLLVDDEDLVRSTTADMLGELGYEVVEARSAGEALTIVDEQPDIGVVVTDHLMPGLSGSDLAATLRRSHPELPVLLVSGYAENEGVASDLPRLSKPFRKDDLAASLTTLAR